MKRNNKKRKNSLNKTPAKLIKRSASFEDLLSVLDNIFFETQVVFIMDFGDIKIEYKAFKN